MTMRAVAKMRLMTRKRRVRMIVMRRRKRLLPRRLVKVQS
jgi:hypothetical protein